MIITGSDQEIKFFINKITKRFNISNCEPVKYILGITIENKNKQYYVHQRNFIDNLLKSYKINNIKKCNTPCS